MISLQQPGVAVVLPSVHFRVVFYPQQQLGAVSHRKNKRKKKRKIERQREGERNREKKHTDR